jgi:chromosome segregation ATPase
LSAANQAKFDAERRLKAEKSLRKEGEESLQREKRLIAKDLAQAKESVEKLESDVKEWEHSSEDLEGKLHTAQESLQRLQSQLATRDASVKLLNDELGNSKTEASGNLARAKELYDEELSKLEKQMEDLHKQIEEAEHEMDKEVLAPEGTGVTEPRKTFIDKIKLFANKMKDADKLKLRKEVVRLQEKVPEVSRFSWLSLTELTLPAASIRLLPAKERELAVRMQCQGLH